MKKQPVEWSKVSGEILFVNISSLSAKSLCCKCHWLLVFDDCSDNAWTYLLKEKSDLKLNVLALIKEFKAKHEYVMKCIQCDIACEKLAL